MEIASVNFAFDANKSCQLFLLLEAFAETKRRAEIGLKRAKDRICAPERKATGGFSPPIMFVGDRGYGQAIKGHLKYDYGMVRVVLPSLEDKRIAVAKTDNTLLFS